MLGHICFLFYLSGNNVQDSLLNDLWILDWDGMHTRRSSLFAMCILTRVL